MNREITIDALDVDCPEYRCHAEPGQECIQYYGRLSGGSVTAQFGQVPRYRNEPHMARRMAAMAATRFVRRAIGQDIDKKGWLAS